MQSEIPVSQSVFKSPKKLERHSRIVVREPLNPVGLDFVDSPSQENDDEGESSGIPISHLRSTLDNVVTEDVFEEGRESGIPVSHLISDSKNIHK